MPKLLRKILGLLLLVTTIGIATIMSAAKADSVVPTMQLLPASNLSLDSGQRVGISIDVNDPGSSC